MLPFLTLGGWHPQYAYGGLEQDFRIPDFEHGLAELFVVVRRGVPQMCEVLERDYSVCSVNSILHYNFMADHSLQKKRHKYIDSDDDAPEVPQMQQASPPPVHQSPRVDNKVPRLDQQTYNYLFEPDSSQPEKKKSIAKPNTTQPAKKTQDKEKDGKKGLKDQKQLSIDDMRYGILRRWWYCLDDWPPQNYDYTAELAKYKLRKVEQQVFRKEPETVDGLRKVYEVNGYKGVFRTSAGDTLDLRPKEGCPSYKNISKLSGRSLSKLLLKGLQRQLKDLQEHEPNNKELARELNGEIEKLQRQEEKYLD